MARKIAEVLVDQLWVVHVVEQDQDGTAHIEHTPLRVGDVLGAERLIKSYQCKGFTVRDDRMMAYA